jgi:hypothetical protein
MKDIITYIKLQKQIIGLLRYSLNEIENYKDLTESEKQIINEEEFITIKRKIIMKNIHILPTDKPSRLYSYKSTDLYLHSEIIDANVSNSDCNNQNIYITSDEEIKEGDWCIYLGLSMTFFKVIDIDNYKLHYDSRDFFNKNICKKIILTTDQDLIKDGVQAIEDEFLEWFVKNPSCEEVKFKGIKDTEGKIVSYRFISALIPKEEPKQETIEEAAERLYPYEIGYGVYDRNCEIDFERERFIEGAKWQQEPEQFFNDDRVKTLERGIEYLLKKQDKNKYSEEEVDKMFETLKLYSVKNVATITNVDLFISSWKREFKKK